jgi:hypothetical protein
LNALEAVTAQITESEGAIELSTMWGGERRGDVVSYTRSITLSTGSTAFDLVDEVSSGIPVAEIQVEIRPVPGLETSSVVVGDDHVDLYFPKTGVSQPRLRISSIDQSVDIEETDGGIIVRAVSVTRLHLRFTAMTAGNPILETGVFLPSQLVQDHNIRAAVLQEGPALQSRTARLSALGFTPGFEAGPYVVMLASADGSGVPEE